MMTLNKNGTTFSNYVDKDLEIYKGMVTIKYLNEKQTSPTTIVLSVFIDNHYIRDYLVRFMDVYGNPLEENIKNSISLMCEIINSFTGENNNGNELTQNVLKGFYKKLHEILVGTAFKRRTDLLDFYDPQVWEDSKNSEAKAFSTEWLDQVKEQRRDEDSRYIPPTKLTGPPFTEEAFR